MNPGTTTCKPCGFAPLCIATLCLLLFCGTSMRSTCEAQTQDVDEAAPGFASGIKVGEATSDSAIVWVRLTGNTTADFGRLPILTQGLEIEEKSRVRMPVDIVPGIAGEIQISYAPGDDDSGNEDRRVTTEWIPVDEQTDFTHKFALDSLQPDNHYHVTVTARFADDQPTRTITATFRTAPVATESVPIRFLVSTCQAVRSLDASTNGHAAYRLMQTRDPHFFVHTGDILYYDKAPLCRTAEEARSKWNLMFAYGHNREFHRAVGSYFMKDDHDTLKDDCWPGQRYGRLTFEEGLEIFREQVCCGDSTYRTIRWGKDVQIWMTENRDFRSANTMEDGPDKTILGEQQKAWLMETVARSDATFKFVITPGPILGPDKPRKSDNHSNTAFQHEGDQLREFLSDQPNTYVICGDRHWQYCSRSPDSGLLEFGCGPINDEHRFGGDPGEDPAMHRYFSPKGGFLEINVEGQSATATWFNLETVNPDGGRETEDDPETNPESDGESVQQFRLSTGHTETLEAK